MKGVKPHTVISEKRVPVGLIKKMVGYSAEMNGDEVIEDLKQKVPFDPHTVASRTH